MKIDLKNKKNIFIIVTVSVLALMSIMIILSPFTPQQTGKDSDNDNITDKNDNCPSIINVDQSDVDTDGIGDVCDNCPPVYNPDQLDDDTDGMGNNCDSCTDTDGDGYGNPSYPSNECPSDNCPNIPNSNQTDIDNDSIGNVCDRCPKDPQNDADNDSICGDVDNCPSIYNPEQKDSDADGIGDTCETPPITDFTYTPIYPTIKDTIQFSDKTTLGGGVLQYWQWTFGDNNTASEQNPKHQYMNTREYTVQLNVTDINGKTDTKNIIVSVNNPPEKPTITGSSNGKTGYEYTYTFKATDPDGDQIYFFINWGDNTSELDLGPYNSGYVVSGKHSWVTKGNYIIKVKVRDIKNAESDYESLTINIYKNIFILNPFFIQFFEKYHQIPFLK